MTYILRFTEEARDDLERLFAFMAQHDREAAQRALVTIAKAWEMLETFPFSCRSADQEDPFLRELIIPFGNAGYVALFEIEDATTVTVLAVRHQLEEDYY